MLIPVQHYRAVASAGKLKGVTCEFCGQQFAYFMARRAEVRIADPTGLDGDFAYSKSESRAKELVRRSLSGDVDIVPCPRCHRLQQDMSRKRTRQGLRRWFRLRTLGILLLAGAGVAILLNDIDKAVLLAGLGLLPFFWTFVRWANMRLQGGNESGSSDSPTAHTDAWTRQELEKLAAENPDIDIADALLDWESAT